MFTKISNLKVHCQREKISVERQKMWLSISHLPAIKPVITNKQKHNKCFDRLSHVFSANHLLIIQFWFIFAIFEHDSPIYRPDVPETMMISSFIELT